MVSILYLLRVFLSELMPLYHIIPDIQCQDFVVEWERVLISEGVHAC